MDKEETMKVPPTGNEGTMSESLPKVSFSEEEKATKEISAMISLSSSGKSIEPSS